MHIFLAGSSHWSPIINPLQLFWDQRKESLQLQQPGCRSGQFAFQLTPMILSSGAQQHMEMQMHYQGCLYL